MPAAVPFIDVRIVDHPVALIAFGPFPADAGAECIFIGRTRLEEHPTKGALTLLSYVTYHDMANSVLRDLARQAVEQFGCSAVRIHHAFGEVPLGAASVLVQVACGHRDKAFEACRFLIDRLKIAAPIWKREVWERGETWSNGVQVIEK